MNKLRNRPKILNILLTGLSGSGKTTIALEVSKYFESINVPHEILDGDIYRAVLSPNCGYTGKERDELRKKIIFVAKLLNKYGVSCIFPTISSSKKVREEARKELANYLEVYVKCPISVCVERDPKSLYKKAENFNKPNIVGIDIPYEEPDSPDLIVETNKMNIESSVKIIVDKIEGLDLI